MGAALAHAHPPEQAEPPRARLSLVKPKSQPMPRELREAGIINTLCDWLSLDARDGRTLEQAFGWPPEMSLRLGLRSVPGPVTNAVLCSELRATFGESDVWPAGFYTDEETGALKLDHPRYGLILQVWRKWPVVLQSVSLSKRAERWRWRSRWLSSGERDAGSHAIASVHCQAMEQSPDEVTRAFMVDDTLAALAVAHAQGVSTIGHNGAAVSYTVKQMLEGFPNLGGVVLAMTDPPRRLESELKAAGLAVSVWGGGELI